MTDERFKRLAEVLTGYSTELKKGEHVLMDLFDVPDAMAVELVKAARRRGAYPHMRQISTAVQREWLLGADEELLRETSRMELREMKKMQAYIAIRGAANIHELSDVPVEISQRFHFHRRPVIDYRINHTKWVVLRWPSPGMAQSAMQSTAAFEDFYFKVCTLDYRRMRPAMEILRRLMAKTDKVHIKGLGTDLRFSIKGIGAVICCGDRNIPDGEVYSCPVKDSVEGQVAFNTPTVYKDGTVCEGVCLKFKKGKVVEATSARNADRLNAVLDSDAGARYIGEFSLGLNPLIQHPMGDILFDEKIAGSFHFTPGQAYEEADNGNRSQVHWDMVSIQRKEYGGGEVWFDGKLIRKNGLFVGGPWTALNPKKLLGS